MKYERYENGTLVESIPYTDEESAALEATRIARIADNRRSAYTAESDPLFLKYQRDEATKQEWLDKINEIKLKYPY